MESPSKPHLLVVHKLVEEADGVGAAADAGQQHVRQAAELLLALPPHLLADHRLEVPHLTQDTIQGWNGAPRRDKLCGQTPMHLRHVSLTCMPGLLTKAHFVHQLSSISHLSELYALIRTALESVCPSWLQHGGRVLRRLQRQLSKAF